MLCRFVCEDKISQNKYSVKPLEVHSLLRMAGRRREKTRRFPGDGSRTIPACLHYHSTVLMVAGGALTDQFDVGAVSNALSTAAIVQSVGFPDLAIQDGPGLAE